MGKFVLVLALILVYRLCTVEAQINFVASGCDGSEFNYTEGSVYENNIKLLFAQLIPESASLKFYNSSAGIGSDEVYGLYQCREDVGLSVCNECVNEITQKIIKGCPLSGDAAAWYLECTLWYADHDIFPIYVTYPGVFKYSTTNISNFDKYAPILLSALNSVIKNASLSMPHFAYGETNFSLSQQLYTFAQCTPGLDVSGCSNCLQSARTEINRRYEGSDSANAFFPSCQLRYAMSPFLNRSSTPAPPPPTDDDLGPCKNCKTSLSPAIIGAIVACGLVGLLVLSFVLWCCFWRKKPTEAIRDAPIAPPKSASTGLYDSTEKSDADSLTETEFVQYNFITLRTATRDFSTESKLGEGGFGSVYKGLLENGQQLAIKRLSETARQGDDQFMTEARVLAKLQHRNLVKLLGFCSQGDEKLLVYEFMPNSSLDSFLFDARKRSYLDWPLRYKIIMGIAKGLQYLHEDSRLTIIHRDLKPANVLLDKEMNPKIADFGLAKLFGGAQKYGNTTSIVGTQSQLMETLYRTDICRGYMAPEYVMTGDYSFKSDVYSFGIMLLEIVSGTKNRMVNRLQPREDLSIQTWRLWNERRSLEITDPVLLKNCSRKEVMRCIQIGLICVQENAEQRPTMAAVVLMLTGSVDLPLPSAPVMSSNQQNMPMIYSGTEQSDGDRYSTQSFAMQTEMDQDLYPAPR